MSRGSRRRMVSRAWRNAATCSWMAGGGDAWKGWREEREGREGKRERKKKGNRGDGKGWKVSAGSPVIQTNLRASKVKMISKPTNQEAARRKQSGEVREKENRCLSLSFFLSPSFSFHASFKHTERSPPREILPPPYSNLVGERGERWCGLVRFGFGKIVKRGSNSWPRGNRAYTRGLNALQTTFSFSFYQFSFTVSFLILLAASTSFLLRFLFLEKGRVVSPSLTQCLSGVCTFNSLQILFRLVETF